MVCDKCESNEGVYEDGDGQYLCSKCAHDFYGERFCPVCLSALELILAPNWEQDWENGIDECWTQWFLSCGKCCDCYPLADSSVLYAEDLESES